MIVTLKDGSKKEYAESKSVYEIALRYQRRTCKSSLCRRE